ncbi:calcium-binding protein [Caulobacter sp.]|uniref:calcium-binding protein n=1 Tax=Caulobacter sp. TaxID=78 RepID=UPI001B0682FD|nr:calcium-binding protein [Caulobacter sp.]MBO9546662.1 hypothetical protein [Caulobacter sp.]
MYLTGTEGDDILVGTADADTILGLGGNDSLQGGEGDDLLIGGAGSDTLDGGAGEDTVSYEDADPAPAASFLMIHLGGSAWELGPTPSPWTDKLVSIENAIGSTGVDWMVGTLGDNKLYGGKGDDKLEGKGGADVLDGGDGNDAISTDSYFDPTQAGSLMIGGEGDDSLGSGNSNDTMLGGAGNDSLSVRNYATTRVVDGGTGVDTLFFTDDIFKSFTTGVAVDLNRAGGQMVAAGVEMTISNVENLTGSNAGDTLIGDANHNVLSGGAGDDQLYGRDGNDTLRGGDGDDYLNGGAGKNVIDGGAGNDTVSYEGVVASGQLLINLLNQSVAVFGPWGIETQDTLTSIENAVGSDGQDWIVGSTGDNYIRGGAGNDMIEGKGGADVLDGGDGNDLISTGWPFGAASSGSVMIGGDGNDTLQSGNSNDTMLGGAGNDFLEVSNYATTRVVDGGADVDTLAFTASGIGSFPTGVFVDLGKATQTIAPGVVLTLSNVENILGTQLADSFHGDAGANRLAGNEGDDWLYGAAGDDVLLGGDGADELRGGEGQDVLNGGAGADTFVFATAESLPSTPDTIVDFIAEDHIQFLDGPSGSATNYAELEAPSPVALASLFAGEGVRYVAVQAGGDVLLYADLGDEGTGYDALIVLTGANLSSIDAGSILGL